MTCKKRWVPEEDQQPRYQSIKKICAQLVPDPGLCIPGSINKALGIGCGVGGALSICGDCVHFYRLKKRSPGEQSDKGPYSPGELSASEDATELDGPLLSEAGGSELISEVHAETKQASLVSKGRGSASGEVASELP
ncbi:hypothetical protein N7478_000607 [Penicillium angulare]|uniref:uncharacterized protein n=1 Tax=Penicillium angulare TaxID=116970 RepID=UPI00254225B8|nr:uncharacterized protein N7478_000607 [Penicillium angulare]KAJ5291356.1 hypothetical protein N7478_000607 [Penicillium angulare]